MAVLKNTYRPYEGPRTPEWSRFLILTRYAYQHVFDSKLLTAFFVACFAFPAAQAILIYLRYNVRAMMVMQLKAADMVPISAEFFLAFMGAQSLMATALTIFVGPGLVSADLANNALPLYLARPFSRAQYVLGKLAVLVIVLSAITWVPGLLLILLQSSLEPGWFSEHARFAWAIFLGSWAWILVLSLVSLALSAWIRWKLMAGAALMGVFFVLAGLGQAINVIFATRWGHVINIGELMKTVLAGLFDVRVRVEIPLPAAWAALGAFCAISLVLLNRKVRAYEVVK